jgi:hypothetical protein
MSNEINKPNTEINDEEVDETSISYAALEKAVKIALDMVHEKNVIVNELLTVTTTDKINVYHIITLLDNIVNATETNATAWLKAINMVEKWAKTEKPEAFLKWAYDRLHQLLIDEVFVHKIKDELNR